MKTYSAKPDELERPWHIVDAEGKPLGRLAVEVAILLRGKHKPQYTPHIDSGDFVVVINAEKVIVTGKKQNQKLYRHHSGYPGGLKTFTYKQMIERNPAGVIEKAVRGMIPHNRLGNRQIKKLKVYTGSAHPHEAQKPSDFVLPAHASAKASS